MNLALIIVGILYLAGVVGGKVVAILSIVGGSLWLLLEVLRTIKEQKKK